ncbi:MAG: hypothetical protein DMF63_11430 [Acidobacteria bacterium]|nr:MAG: hypothetical protein DMF63_11430 [Acidobacteriota bacterium]
MSRVLAFRLLSFAFVIFVIGSYVIVAQNVITGSWTGDTKDENPDKIQLNFEMRTEKGSRNNHGSSFAYSDLQGLSRDQAQNGKVSFSLVREAGTIQCDGTFTNGKGAGTFRFTPNYGFADAMKSRGFDFGKPSKHGQIDLDQRLFTATTLNVTTAFADDLKSANFGPLDVDDLFKAVIFKITPQFMAEMKATGFPDLGMEELVKARIFKIDADYVRQVHDMGFASSDFEEMVKFRIFKVTPEFLNELKAEGISNLSSEDIVKFRIFKIDPQFIREARSTEPNITAEELVQMKIGVRRRTR